MLRAGVGKCNLCFFREKIRIHSSWYLFYGNVCESEAVPEESLKINYMFYLRVHLLFFCCAKFARSQKFFCIIPTYVSVFMYSSSRRYIESKRQILVFDTHIRMLRIVMCPLASRRHRATLTHLSRTAAIRMKRQCRHPKSTPYATITS